MCRAEMNETNECEGGVTLHPCCVGLLGECVVTTEDNCTFQDGYWHPDKVREECVCVCGWVGDMNVWMWGCVCLCVYVWVCCAWVWVEVCVWVWACSAAQHIPNNNYMHYIGLLSASAGSV